MVSILNHTPGLTTAGAKKDNKKMYSVNLDQGGRDMTEKDPDGLASQDEDDYENSPELNNKKFQDHVSD